MPNAVHVYKLAGKKLLELCKEYPDFRRFLVLRACQRRSNFIKVLNEIQQLLELDEKNKVDDELGVHKSEEEPYEKEES